MIEQTRLLTLHAAHALDTLGNRVARKQVKLSIVCFERGNVLCLNSRLYINGKQYILLLQLVYKRTTYLTDLYQQNMIPHFCPMSNIDLRMPLPIECNNVTV